MKYLLIALLLVSSVTAYSSFFPTYNPEIDGTNIYICVSVTPDNITKGLNMKAVVDMDENEVPTLRNCRDGIMSIIPYNRYLWIKDSYYHSDITLLSNYANFKTTFASSKTANQNLNTLFLEDAIEYVPAFVNNPTNNANHYLLYDTVRGVDYSKDDSAFYYSIGNSEAHGMSNYATGSTFASQNSFTSAGLAYPPQDLSNPEILLNAGHTCGAYRCVNETSLDVELKDYASKAFFGFSPTLNYYYYPFYIDAIEYKVVGYTNSSKTTQTYYRKGTIFPTSTDIEYPLTSTNNAFTILDRTFNFGSKLNYDGSIAFLPNSTGYSEVGYTVYLRRNPYYRHRSPVDSSWSLTNITSTSCTGISGMSSDVCNDKTSIGLSFSKNINVTFANSSTTIPNTPPDQLDNNTPHNDNNATPNNGTGGDIGGNISYNGSTTNGTGVDWNYNPNAGGGLQGQIDYANGEMNIENQNTFFSTLEVIALTIFEILLTLFTLVILVAAIYLFIIMIPSAYRKFLRELKRLGDMRWR